MSFWGQLGRRNVLRVGFAYLAVVWVLLQVADVIVPILEAPEWLLRTLFFASLLGFPLALVLAWFYELTPEGIKAASDVEALKPVRFMGRKLDYAIIGLLVLAVGFLVADNYVFEEQTPVFPGSVAVLGIAPNSVAVLPFLNIGGDEEGRIFSEGLAEDVINRLATVSGLRVSSRGDSFSLAPNSASQDVRKRLRVAYYIEGSIRFVGDAMRVVVQLINSEDGFHVFSRSFDRPRTDFFALQDEITNLTVANLRVAMPQLPEDSFEPVFDDTDNLDLYVSYRAGLDALRRPWTEETMVDALDAFGRALSVDPDYAAAYAGICMTYVSGYRLASTVAYIGEAERSCSAALALNPNLDIVHNALGDLYIAIGRYEEGEMAFERALEINNRSVDSLIGLGSTYEAQQRLAEAEDTLKEAIGLQPGNWRAYNELGRFLFLNGRYDESVQIYREVVSLDVGNFTGWTNLATALMLAGELTESVSAFERALDVQETSRAYINLGLLYYYLGDPPKAIAALETAINMTPDDVLAWSNLGDALTFSDEPERADQAFANAERLGEARMAVNARDAGALIDLAWIKAMLGNLEDAQRLMARALEIDPTDPYVHYIDGLILVQVGDNAGAIERLKTALETGYPLALMAAEPHLEPLRDDPRFLALINE